MIYDDSNPNFEIQSDGNTVWVNDAEGASIGRFGLMGIDVHHHIEDQAEHGQCLACTHERTNKADWYKFKQLMKDHFGVDISDEHMPKRFMVSEADRILQLAGLSEAKTPAKTTAAPKPDDTALAHSLYVKANEAAKKIGNTEFTIRTGWNPEWAKILQTVVGEAKKEHDELQAEEKNWDEDHVAVPFSLKNDLPRSLEIMWNRVIELALDRASLDIGEDEKEYRRYHPYTEMSDEMILRDDEKLMLWHIRKSGFFDLQGMIQVCQYIEDFAESVDRNSQHGMRICSPGTHDFIIRTMPYMLVVAKAYGAGK